MIATDTMKRFVAESGREFYFRPQVFTDHTALLFSPDGEEFFMTKATRVDGYSGIISAGLFRKLKLDFTEPRTGISGTLHFDNDTIEFDGETFHCVGDIADNTEYWPLPEFRTPVFLGKVTMSGLYLYVSTSNEDSLEHRRVRVFLGSENAYEEKRVVQVTWLDDEIASITLERGQIWLNSLTPMPHWNEFTLIPCDTADFDIVEIHDGLVSITRK